MSVEEDSQGKRRWKAPADSRPPARGRAMAKKEKVRKKTLGKSSREWVDRQLHDPYVIRARVLAPIHGGPLTVSISATSDENSFSTASP